jgi:hypothetical protein
MGYGYAMALTLSPQLTRSIVAHQKSGESPIGVDLVEEPDRTVLKKIFVHTGGASFIALFSFRSTYGSLSASGIADPSG